MKEESVPGCKRVWTVYHKNPHSHVVDPSKAPADDDGYHAYLIVSLESRTMLFGTLDGSIGCITLLDELTFRGRQSLQKKLVDAVFHVAGLNPRSFRQFHSNGRTHRPCPGSIVECELLCHAGGAVCARIKSSYMISLRDLDMKHIKGFIFINGYIEPVMVILDARELTWAGLVSLKHHTCMISALSIRTMLRQHPLVWSATSTSCVALNYNAAPMDRSQEMSRSNFIVELDAANATWLTNDVCMLSMKAGDFLLLTLVYDGRIAQRLELSRSRASVLTSGLTNVWSSFFLGSRLGDSILVQFTYGAGASILVPGVKEEEVGDIESDVPSAKRLRIARYGECPLHCCEGPDWQHIKRGRESLARGPIVKVDPQGRCAVVLVYGLQMVVLKAAEVILCPVMVILHERELAWAVSSGNVTLA
ncbi:hypothetical protein ACH5RR_010757 [Cinchona calisaya]|uniref:RSE1/DDB1/CPSF1 C-terminal domain-containing protein n=1 Tax=Cinchona calisaya TaxID=153742 RepID=A0ABD3AJT8_9GENT